MKGAIGSLVIATLLLSGCGFRDSGLNPFNWFGRSQPAATTADGVNPLIPRRTGIMARRDRGYPGDTIARITDLTIERLPGGAIIRATGISDRNGPYQARLHPQEGTDPSVKAFDFEVVTPNRARSTETELVRTVTVATYLSDRELRGVRTIRVQARSNARASTRR